MFPNYDVIVVGAGHAGCEAAAAAANMGSKVLLITMNMQTIAQMSCNPAMGGIAKGQIVREIDALGGYSGIVSDQSMLQFRMLNRSKGPAMWSPRSQNDRMLFSQKWRQMLEETPNVHLYQDMVIGLLLKNGNCNGVITGLGHHIKSKSVVLTNGTFLNGIIHIGEKNFGGGRAGRKSCNRTDRTIGCSWISKVTDSRPVHLQELMEEAWTIPRWNNSQEMMKSLDSVSSIYRRSKLKNKKAAGSPIPTRKSMKY